MVDTPESDESDDCKSCGGEMVPLLIKSLTDESLGITWSRYRLQCDECGHTRKEYDVTD